MNFHFRKETLFCQKENNDEGEVAKDPDPAALGSWEKYKKLEQKFLEMCPASETLY